MDGVIVDSQTEREPLRDLVVNRLKELAELHRPRAMNPRNHSTALKSSAANRFVVLHFVER